MSKHRLWAEFYTELLNEMPRIGLWLESSGQTSEETVEEIFYEHRQERGLLLVE